MVPNVFTPNKDLVNDYFRPLFSGFSNMTFTVYDFRGNVILMSIKKRQILIILKDSLLMDGTETSLLTHHIIFILQKDYFWMVKQKLKKVEHLFY